MEIWIGRDGERHGPYKEDDVRQWLRSGQVSRDDLAWYEGLADWQPLSVLFPDVVPDASAAPATPMAATPLPQTTTAALEDHAGFWKRVAAYILDFIILLIPSTIIQKMMGSDAAQETMKQTIMATPNDMQVFVAAYQQYYATMWPALLIVTVVTWIYFAACESSTWQATVGKLALGIRVVDEQGGRISFLRATGRFFAKYLSSLIILIGFLMVAWTRRKQGLHDIICNTLVLNGRASEFKPTAPSSTSGGSNTFSA
ncbi:RDD family protein [Rhodanobacter sp. L36]|uniref:RDD family protein n=1 Tax=Rhodanobacter sp. L36 TaxID=1747221 RepID=UPI00131B9510|nr:RDD family protein [Rhodanobacter sp. L36]